MARDDSRRLLKEFGIGADGAVISHLARNREINELSIRLRLVDETDYGDSAPDQELEFEVVGTIQQDAG
jgi:uncharacterized protein YjbK